MAFFIVTAVKTSNLTKWFLIMIMEWTADISARVRKLSSIASRLALGPNEPPVK
jgi:hypothetical protein